MTTTRNPYLKARDGELVNVPDAHPPLYYIRHDAVYHSVTYLRVTSVTENYVSGFLCDGGWPTDKSGCGRYLTVQGERQYTSIPVSEIDVMRRERSRSIEDYPVG
jgi:hypothetical protein